MDDDDDNDSLLDTTDRFAVDADNGTSTPLGTLYNWENEGQNDGGILGLGFTGLMTNDVANYESLFNPQAVTAGGAAGVFTIDSATSGTARGSINTQQQAFQFGVNVGGQTSPFTARTSVLAPFSGLSAQPGQEMGMFIGTGDQDNFVQLVLSGDNGGSIQLMQEVGGVFTTVATQPINLPGAGFVELLLTVDPTTQTVQASYIVDGGAPTALGSPLSIPTSWIADVMAVGLIATDPTTSGAMPVNWDFLGVVSSGVTGDPKAFLFIDPLGGLHTSSTFADNSFQITNNSTGNVRIQSVTIDTRTALLPDVVFDPTGEGGNDVPKPFTPDSGEAETGLLGHSLLSPHDEGFNILEIQFSDFDPGEVFTFSIDTEPTSIKGAEAPGPGNAGKISGLELSGSTVTIVFSDGTTTQTQTFRTPSSGRASQTYAENDLPPTPEISLPGSIAPPAVVFDPAHNIRITGPAGTTARLLHVETALYLAGVPGGGFDIDPFEANKAIKLSEHNVTIGASGFVDVPVTLTRSEPEGGLNYFVAAIEDSSGRTGGISEKIILQLDDPTVSGSAARLNVYPNGGITNSSTFNAGSIQVLNQSASGEKIISVQIDLNGSLLPDVVFDPNGVAGDPVGKDFTPDSGAAITGLLGHSLSGPHDGGFDSLSFDFSDFEPGEVFTFSIDIDPTSIQGAAQPGPEKSGSISGVEISGATATVTFSNGSTRSGNLFAVEGSKTNSHVILGEPIAAPSIEMLGIANTPTTVSEVNQTIRITGPQGATVQLLQAESALLLEGVPGGGFDIDPFETNKVIFVAHAIATIEIDGFVDVAVTLNNSHLNGGMNHFSAVVVEPDGRTSEVSNSILVAVNEFPSGATQPTLAGDYDGNDNVDSMDHQLWSTTFGTTGESPLADGNLNGTVDAADYVIWRKSLNAVQQNAAAAVEVSAEATAGWESHQTTTEPASLGDSTESISATQSGHLGSQITPKTLNHQERRLSSQLTQPRGWEVNDFAVRQLNLLRARHDTAGDMYDILSEWRVANEKENESTSEIWHPDILDWILE